MKEKELVEDVQEYKVVPKHVISNNQKYPLK